MMLRICCRFVGFKLLVINDVVPIAIGIAGFPTPYQWMLNIEHRRKEKGSEAVGWPSISTGVDRMQPQNPTDNVNVTP
jgi:hypothetical protein